MYNHSNPDTFPVKRELKQHLADVDDDDVLSECISLASRLIGIQCDDTVSHMDNQDEEGKTFYEIAPYAEAAVTIAQNKEYEAFLSYFRENYGIRDDRCYFSSPYEAFFNVVKAWYVWKEILSKEDKERYY